MRLSGHVQLWHLVVLQALAGAGTAFHTPAAAGLLPATVDPDDVQPANALLSLSTNVTKVAAIGVAGVLVATVGPGWALLIDAATFTVSAACLATLPAAGTVPARTSITRSLAGGWQYVRTTR